MLLHHINATCRFMSKDKSSNGFAENLKRSLTSSVAIHRAGRWGGNDRTAALLEDLNIKVDLSPSTGYRDPPVSGPDFSNLDGSPFWSGPRQSILTIPASSLNYLRGPAWLSTTSFKAKRRWPIAGRGWIPLGKPVRFSPENANSDTLVAMTQELRLRGIATAVYTLHSTSLYAGGNQYSSTPADTDALLSRSFEFLKHAIESGSVKPTTCASLYDQASALRARHGANSRTGSGECP